MKVVITGPTGAIGIALVKECVARQIEVLAICHKDSQRIGRLPKSPMVQVLELDLQDYREFQPDTEQTDYEVFYHFAWNGTIGDVRNDMDVQHANVGYALDAVSLAKRFGCHTFIGAGSQAEYGRVEGKLCASTPAFPENGYGIAKLCAGQMTRIACEQVGLKHMWVRILSVYGPYDGEKTMITGTIRKLLAKEVPEFTKGEQQWDYLYSGDAAKAMYLLAEKGKDGKIYCLGSGNARPLAEYIKILRDAVDEKAPLALGAIPYANKQVMYLCADIEELQADTGFVPGTDFEEGIRQTVAWIKQEDEHAGYDVL